MTYDWESDYNVRGKLHAKHQAENEGDAVLLGPNGKVPARFLTSSEFKYTLAFDATTFLTDPTACLVYANDCTGFTPVDNSEASVLTAPDPGSWDEHDPLISSMFYATIAEGTIHHVLDPTDLTKDINGVDRSTEIQQEDVMLVIPTLYSRRGAGGVTISSRPSDGTPYAHTYDGHTYNYLAIGVYEGSIQNDKLMSVSNATPTIYKTRSEFRTAAQAKGEGHMLTNWHTRQLIRDLAIMTTKSFDSPGKLGYGFIQGGNSTTNPDGLTTGLANQLGRFAGNKGDYTSVVKCLIENPWGSKWEFIDDILTGYNELSEVYDDIYVGQQLQVQDDITNMTLVDEIESTDMHASTNAFCTVIHTDDMGWGLWANHDGTSSTGLCDRHWSNPSVQRLAMVGGGSADGTNGGLSALLFDNGLTTSRWNVGARPVYVFD